MSVPNQTPYIIYNANGITTVFPFEFYIIAVGDIQVSVNGTVVTNGYSISGAGNVSGGDVVFLTPPAAGSVVMLERVVPTYRLTDYQDNGDLLADTINKDFDRLWMAIQRSSIYLGLALRRPLLGGPFNAEGYRIEGLADPVNDQDAATKKYVETVSLARTLRVPESTVNPIPLAQIRANQLLAFNAVGDPIAVLPASGSASDVLIELAKPTGAGKIGTSSGHTVQDELDNLNVSEFSSFNSAINNEIKSCYVDINYKYGTIRYKRNGVTGNASTGDAYLFCDSTGKQYQIVAPTRPQNAYGVHCFSEIWASENLDPTYFYKLYDLGVSTIVLYTWKGNSFDYHKHFLELAHAFGFGVILQAVPDQEYTDNLDDDFSYLMTLFEHPAVKGLYLLDEPNAKNFPLLRQGNIIAKARSLSNLPMYAATNSEANGEVLPLHMDFDFVYTSNYSHYNPVDGLLFYAATTWSSFEEEGIRSGRVIPLLTSYWYEQEVTTINKPQMQMVNDYLSKGYNQVGLWMFWGARSNTPGYHYLENNSDIFSITKSALEKRCLSKVNRSKLLRTFFGPTALPTDSFKFLTKAVSPADIPWIDPASASAWLSSVSTLRIRTGDTIIVKLGSQVRLRCIHASFIDDNGPADNAVLQLVYNPTVAGGRPEQVTKAITGGGAVIWTFPADTLPTHKVASIGIRVLSMSTPSNPPDYLRMTNLSFVTEG